MKRKLLIMLCIAALSMSFAACGDSSSSSTKEASSKSSSISSEVDESKSDDISSTDSKNDSVEDPSSTEDYVKRPDPDSSRDEPDNEALSIVNKMNDAIKNAKSTSMDGTINMSVKMDINYNGESIKQSMVNDTKIEALSVFNKGAYTKTTSTIDEGQGATTTTELKYIVEAEKSQYVSTDNGSTWTKSAAENTALDGITNMFNKSDTFKNAKVENTENGYKLTIDLAEVKEFTNSITSNTNGLSLTGNLIIEIDKDYLPISMFMDNLKFDTSALESSILAQSDSSNNSTVDIDMNIDFNIKYKDWNNIDENKVVPNDSITKSAIPGATVAAK